MEKEVEMRDSYGRTIDYMRISITDRCNLRCRYCMPEGISQVPMKEILTYEEIVEICQAASGLGIRRLKITGGEPLARACCPELIGMLKKIPGIRQVTMTTNGVALQQHLPRLLEQGLDAVNISLDTLNPQVYQQITGKDALPYVLEGIRQAVRAGLPTKLNVVLQPAVNSEEWLELAKLTNVFPVDVRFIEMMPIGFGKNYRPISNQDLLLRFQSIYPGLQRDESLHGNGPAVYYRIPGAKGSIGFISALHGKFCGSCNRLRLTSRGKLKPCLCFEEEVDLMEILRGEEEAVCAEAKQEMEGAAGGSLHQEMEGTAGGNLHQEMEGASSSRRYQGMDNTVRKELLQQRILQAVSRKPREHHFEMAGEVTERKQMVQIGG